MTNRIEKIYKPIDDWYQTSGIKAFFDWWTTELKSWIPENQRKRFFSQAKKIYIVPETDSEQQAVLWQQQDSSMTALPLDETAQDKAWWHQLNHQVATAEEQCLISYLLPEEQVLIREVAMPRVAADNLSSVLQYELDKYIPFAATDVEFSFRRLPSSEGSEKIPVQLVIIKRDALEKIEQELIGKSVPLASIDVNSGTAEQPQALGVNLLSESLRQKKDWSKIKINALLLVAVIFMLWFVMYSSLENKKDKITKLEQQSDELRNESRKAKRLEQQLLASISAANFLGDKKQNSPSATQMLDELTSKIPADTYLTRMLLNNERIEFVGQSLNANALVPILNRSTLWFEPSIVGQVVPDARTGKERFTIKSNLKPPVEEDSDES